MYDAARAQCVPATGTLKSSSLSIDAGSSTSGGSAGSGGSDSGVTIIDSSVTTGN